MTNLPGTPFAYPFRMDSPDSANVKPHATQVSLVSPRWVATQANGTDLRILDVRPDVYAYFMSHVPNAVHISEAVFRAPLAGLPAQYLSPDHTAYLLSRAGISRSSRVLLHSDDDNVLGCTMVAYVLAKLGHPEILIMDGGWMSYKSQHPVTQEFPTYSPNSYPSDETVAVGIGLQELRELQQRNAVKIIDSRPEKAYRGETKFWIRNGHIPGAINIDWQRLVIKESLHTFKPLSDIASIYASAGITKDDDIVIYCGTGREATVEYVALKHLLNFPKVRIYEGSWNEYSSYPELPVATGNTPYAPKAA
jgi:thiosulfate/3-mercaptopyruvate sulfurtransferase